MGVYEKDKVIYDEKINDWITFMDVISLDFSCLSAFYLKFVFEVLSWVWWWKKNALREIELWCCMLWIFVTFFWGGIGLYVIINVKKRLLTVLYLLEFALSLWTNLKKKMEKRMRVGCWKGNGKKKNGCGWILRGFMLQLFLGLCGNDDGYLVLVKCQQWSLINAAFWLVELLLGYMF